jgi:hypothetical protein
MSKFFNLTTKTSCHQNDLKVFNLRMLVLLVAFLVIGCQKAEITPAETQNLSADSEKAATISAVKANYTLCYWADLLIQNVTNANNIYSTLNSDDLVTWAGVNGAKLYYCKTDCSGLLKNLMKQTYGYTDTYFRTWTGTINPYAATYYNEISTKDHFSQISTATTIIRGDIIAIKYPAGTSTNTGHIMLVASVPVLRASTPPLVSNTKQYEVSVIDASSSGHGSLDTRYISTGNFNDGIGRGIFRLYTNTKGAIVGYCWSNYSTSDYYTLSARPLLIGRLIP